MPDRMDELYAETIRTRERLHRLETTVAALTLRHDLMTRTVEGMKETVDGMARAEDIADAVAERISHRRRVVFSTAQKVALVVFGALSAVNVALNLLGLGPF